MRVFDVKRKQLSDIIVVISGWQNFLDTAGYHYHHAVWSNSHIAY